MRDRFKYTTRNPAVCPECFKNTRNMQWMVSTGNTENREIEQRCRICGYVELVRPYRNFG